MRLKSHFSLARYMLGCMPSVAGPLEACAFLFGNIQPDLKINSYFRNVAPGDEGRGHSYNTAMMRITRILESLDQWSSGIAFAYRLGKISHYAADIFTYPHNPDLFHGSLKDHMKYERVLDDHLRAEIYSRRGDTFVPERTACALRSALLSMHEEYEKNEMSPENDLHFILDAAAMVVAELAVVNTKPLIKGVM